MEPVWSRDGRLAFLQGQGATAAIYDGTTTRTVQLPFAEIDSLAWSPDGTRFVVAGKRAGDADDDLYTVRTDGSGLRRLTRDLGVRSADWR